MTVTKTIFESTDVTTINIESLLFQTGYITITNIDESDLTPTYTLDYPNHEVRWSFIAHILESYAQMPRRDIEPGALKLKKTLEQGDIPQFLTLLKAYFALIPYQLRYKADEAYYHALFQMVFTLLGIQMVSERSTDKGRIDGFIEFKDKIYIIEFKHARKGTLKTLVKKALQQIKDNHYSKAFEVTDKTVYLIGVGFLEKNKDNEGKILLEIDLKWDIA